MEYLAMAGRLLRCAVTSGDGARTEHTAEIEGEGNAYLQSLSQNLASVQKAVNGVLTELVEKTKREQELGKTDQGTINSHTMSECEGTSNTSMIHSSYILF